MFKIPLPDFMMKKKDDLNLLELPVPEIPDNTINEHNRYVDVIDPSVPNGWAVLDRLEGEVIPFDNYAKLFDRNDQRQIIAEKDGLANLQTFGQGGYNKTGFNTPQAIHTETVKMHNAKHSSALHSAKSELWKA